MSSPTPIVLRYRILPMMVAVALGAWAGFLYISIDHRLYQERYWDEHPGKEPPYRQPWFYLSKIKATPEDWKTEEETKATKKK